MMYLVVFLAWLSASLFAIVFWSATEEKEPPPVIPPPVKVFKKKTQPPRKKGKCIQTDKLCRLECTAKERAAQLKLRAYKCEFCDFWHLTHKRSYL